MILRLLITLGVGAMLVYVVTGLAASNPPSTLELVVIVVFLLIIFSLAALRRPE